MKRDDYTVIVVTLLFGFMFTGTHIFSRADGSWTGAVLGMVFFFLGGLFIGKLSAISAKNDHLPR